MNEIMEGSHAIAHAIKMIRPQVIAAYPITPQTHIVEALADIVADGLLDADYVTVESEFSALSVCLGACAAGSRVYSATTSQGLALMYEVCFNVAGLRLPIVMSIVNRAMGAPLNIWNDQQDSISLRDSGWLQFYAEDNQEATDLHYIAYKVAEDQRVLLPAFVCLDGFILSHTYEPVDMLTQEQVDSYLQPYRPTQKLDAKNPASFGMYATPDYYTEFRYETDMAVRRAGVVWQEAATEFFNLFGRDYSEPLEKYRLDDADIALISMGSLCGTIKDAVDELRDNGKKVGLLKIRSFRPFPTEEMRKALTSVSKIAVLEKNISLGTKGAVYFEVLDSMYNTQVPVMDYVLGLGGRDVRKRDIHAIVDMTEKGKPELFYGLKKELL